MFVHFQMQFDEKLAVLLQRLHIMNRQAQPLRLRADGFE